MVSGREPLKVLALGAGVQSTALLLMSLHGDLGVERVDAAIFGDTQWERAATYAHLDRLSKECEHYGVPLYRVTAGNLRQDALERQVLGGRSGGSHKRFASMPLRIRNRNGTEGLMRRQCSAEYKLAPCHQQLRRMLGLAPRQRAPRDVAVERWLGISLDEARRAGMSKDRWVDLRYPLIEMKLTRTDCLEYLRAAGWPNVPRSSCIGCPYHNNAEWRDIRDNDPEAWADACAFDAAVRHCHGLDGEAYLHRSLLPLAEAPIDDPRAGGTQLEMCWECGS